MTKEEKNEQKQKEKEAKTIAKQNKRLIDSALRSANGYYVTEEQAFKIKTFEKVDGQLQPVEDVKIVRIQKYIPPDTKDREFLIKSRIPGYGDAPQDNELHIMFSDEVRASHDEMTPEMYEATYGADNRT